MVTLKFMWLQHWRPTSITNCATARLVWSCLLSACPFLLWDHLERTSPSIQRLVSSHSGTCPTEESDEPSCFPIQHQQGPGLIALLKMLRPDGNSHLEEALQNACIYRTLLSKNKKRSLVFVSKGCLCTNLTSGLIIPVVLTAISYHWQQKDLSGWPSTDWLSMVGA